jgi:hypothetical protein
MLSLLQLLDLIKSFYNTINLDGRFYNISSVRETRDITASGQRDMRSRKFETLLVLHFQVGENLFETF